MSGHFLVWDITTQDLMDIKAAFDTRVSMSELAHADVGWTIASRAALQRVRNGQAIPDRGELPPHKYIRFNSGALTADQLLYMNNTAAVANSWVANLCRPNVGGLQLTALYQAAQSEWALGHAVAAFDQQLQRGDVSIEFYYVDGEEAGHHSGYGYI